jgi:arylsulfatase A-like enzyme
MNQPNILLIMSDQQRFDSLGCYGADWIATPNLDSLAADGILYENCYVNNPICTPSRASLFTGKEIPGHGVLRLHDVLPEDEILFPKHLQDLGYTTALFGKLHVSGRIEEEAVRHRNDGFDIYEWCLEASISMDSPLNGYSRWLEAKDPEFYDRLKREGRKLLHIPREYHMTHWAAERSIDFLKEQNGEKPFFCMMSVFDPHNPYDDYPAEYAARVDERKMPSPKAADEVHRIRGMAQEQRDGYFGCYNDFAEEDIREMRRGYYASVALLDDEIGRVLAALEEQGLKDNTLIIFLSDHGDNLGDHALMVKGGFFYEPCVKVPFILRDPRSSVRGVRKRELVQPHDLAATILAAAGMPAEGLDALMPESRNVLNPDRPERRTAICAYRETGIDKHGRYFDPPINATMITDGRFKLNFYHPEVGIEESPVGQLFDLENDPRETQNLWDTDTRERLRLTVELTEWFRRQERYSGRRARSAVPRKDQLIKNAFSAGKGLSNDT